MGNGLIKIEYLGIIFSTGYWEVGFFLKEVFYRIQHFYFISGRDSCQVWKRLLLPNFFGA
jgi:hypothetical protein